MAEKKRRGRRAYLSDFQPQLDGKYVYTGALHYYEGADRKRSMALLWGLTAALAAGALVPGLVRAAGMDNHFYVILPWAAELMAAVSVVWAMCRLSVGGDPLRDYIFEATVAVLPLRAAISAGLAVLTLAGECVYLFLNGPGEKLPGTVALVAAQAVLVLSALGLRKAISGLRWSEERPEL